VFVSPLRKRADGSWCLPVHRWLTAEGIDRLTVLAALALVAAAVVATR
jgi:hypothetical protein